MNTRLLPDDPMLPRPFRIVDARADLANGSVFSWTLQAQDGQPLHYRPGQFNMLYQFGIGEVPLSISGDAQSGELVHTVRAVGSVTRCMQKLGVNAIVGVRGPFGSHWPLEAAHGKDLVLVAGGIGLAPLRPVVYHVLRHPEQFGRVFLLYGAREPSDILYHQELKSWRRQGIDVQITVDRGSRHWRGNIGVVTRLIARSNHDRANSVAMLCGPEIMIQFAVQALEQQGLPAERIFVSMERNMKCAIGHCGHCQYGPYFMCREGPVFAMSQIASLFNVREF